MSSDTVPIQGAPVPTHLVDNENVGTGGGGLPIERQRTRLGGVGLTDLTEVARGALKTLPLGSLVPYEFDEVNITPGPNGPSVVVYKNASVTVATLTLTYTSGNLTSVVRS